MDERILLPRQVMFELTGLPLLAAYLDTMFSCKVVDYLMMRYYVGQRFDGASVLWQTDENGNCVGGDVAMIDEKGRIEYVIRLLENSAVYSSHDIGFFGGHLIVNSSTIGVVQDCLQALIFAGQAPNITWLAVGEDRLLTEQKINKLIGKKVILLPRCIESETWSSIAKKFRGEVYIKTLAE